MAENRFSFTSGEMNTLKAVLDFALERIDERLQSGYRVPSETEVFALRLSRTKCMKLRGRIFTAAPTVTPVAARAKAPA